MATQDQQTVQNMIQALDRDTYADERAVVARLIETANLSAAAREAICAEGVGLVEAIRARRDYGLMEKFLAEYGLSTQEGIALMCLAEALLRVPDAPTMAALIEDKIAPGDWAKHLGQSTSPLVNASTWALMLTGKVLEDTAEGPVKHLRGAIKRMGEPAIRSAVHRAMEIMGRQFVLGETIQKAMKRAQEQEQAGYTYSYDMLGEAALTAADAERYHLAYAKAITAIAEGCSGTDIRLNPGISIKLSALFPRYEVAQRDRVLSDLVPRVLALATMAKSAGMGLTIDAEEADRLSLSLDVIYAVLSEPVLAGWDGFGVVVQAYGKRASNVIDCLQAMTVELDRRITIRLVKGAYWDTEIKLAQTKGVDGFPVFTSKVATDVSYIAMARKLLSMTDRIYPQFATHNAHTMAAVLHMAQNQNKDAYEFQRLHGMGEHLHDLVKAQEKTRCRVYAPVGAHKDLLAYLVRRLLENGANSSFVNQIVDEDVPPINVVADPFATVLSGPDAPIPTGPELFQPQRINAKGWDLMHAETLSAIEVARAPFTDTQWQAKPLLAASGESSSPDVKTHNPADPTDWVGTVQVASPADIEAALTAARPWTAPVADRARVLNAIADAYEANYGELFAILAREAGKTLPDAVAEIREAVDFLRFYAAESVAADATSQPVGLYTCISPWNFPLAIFTGQIAAALAVGNGVLAKPADQTPLIAVRAVQLMHAAGVPAEVLQLLPGQGDVGAALTRDPRVGGVAFTGSTATAQRIRQSMATHLTPGSPLIAETGGLNAMIIDSTALPEQAVRAVIESAFQSSGQRCSALRCLYVQEDIAESFSDMLFGAMDELMLSNPWALKVDAGPVIDAAAQSGILAHIDQAASEGRVVKQVACPSAGTFVPPTVITVDSITQMGQEIFGPVLHLATFRAAELETVIADINSMGYGLTFGLQTRIDDRVEQVCQTIDVGNIYVNRNQIGAIVGSQPFGGHGLSGTGPKAGGPAYLDRFRLHPSPASSNSEKGGATSKTAYVSQKVIQDRLAASDPGRTITEADLPGPTGESNRYATHQRAPILCLGPTQKKADEQANLVRARGGLAIAAADLDPNTDFTDMTGFSSVMWWGDAATARQIDESLAALKGPLMPLITGLPDQGHLFTERHICVDTTASGGNTDLLMMSDHSPQDSSTTQMKTKGQ